MIRMSRRRRRLFIVCAFAAAAAVSGIAALHTPWARARVLAAALSRIAPDGSVSAERLDYRLPTLWFRLQGLQVRTSGQERPYFTAEELSIDLPWSAAWRGLAFQHIELRRPRLAVFVDADGLTNFAGEATRIDTPIPFDRLQVSGLQIEWRDDTAGYAFEADGIDLELGDLARGRLQMPAPARVRVADRRLEIALAGGDLDWDGRDLGIDALRLDSAASELNVDGSIKQLLADRELGLDISARTSLGMLTDIAGLDVAGESLLVTGRLEGPAQTPTANLELEMDSAMWRDIALRGIRGHINADHETVRLSALRAGLAGGEVIGEVEVGLESDAASRLTAEWKDIDAGTLVEGYGATSIVPAARLDGELRAQWPGPRPSLAGVRAVLSTELTRVPTSSDGIALDGRFDAELAAGEWFARGQVAVAAAMRINTDLSGNATARTVGGTMRLDVNDLGAAARPFAGLAPGLAQLAVTDGRATARLTLGGTVTDPTISGNARIEQLRVADAGPMTLETDLIASAESLRIHNATVEFPGGSLEADLQIDAAGRLHGRVEGGASELSLAVAQLPIGDRIAAAGGVSGSATWDLTLEGTLPLPDITGTVSAEGIRIGSSVPIDASARLSSSDYGIRVDELIATSGDNRLTLSGVIGAEGQSVDLLGELDVQAPEALTDRPELAYLRSARAEIAIGIDFPASIVVVDLWSLHADLPRFPVRSLTPGRLTWSPAEVSVEDFALRVGDLDLAVGGTLGGTATQGIHGRLRGDLSRLSDLATMALVIATDVPDRQPVVLSGNLDVDLRLGGTLAEPRPRGSLRVSDGNVVVDGMGALEALQLNAEMDSDGLRIGQLRGRFRGGELEGEASLSVQALVPALSLDSASADIVLDSLFVRRDEVTVSQQRPTRLRLEAGTMRIVDWFWSGSAQDDLSLALAGSVELRHPRVLDLLLTSNLGLAWLGSMTGAAALDGAAHASVTITGTAGDPIVNGNIDLTDLGFVIADPQVVVSDVNGTLAISGTELRAEGLRGIANGGEAMLFLDLDLADPLNPSGLAELTARSIVVEVGGGRALGDADVTVSASQHGGRRAFGEIRLLAGGYRTDASLAADLVRASAVSQTPAADRPSLFDDLAYDLRVTTVEDLRIATPYAELGLATDLQIVGTFARPGVLGRMTVRDGGVVRLAGHAYSVDRGVIEFAETNRVAPTLDIAARAEIGGEQISVLLTGSAFDPTVEASAESGLDSGDVLSLMATGRTAAAAGDAGREVLAEQAFDLLTGQYLAGAVQRLGFESVRFERGGSAAGDSELFPRDTDLASRLTLTRSIRNTFDLVFSQNLTNADERSWIGTLRLPFGLALRGGTFDDGTRSLELQHRLTLGSRTPTGDSGGRAPPVRSVRFEGSPGYAEDVLRQQIRVRAGDRFDFLRWQEDRDRLLRLYHRGGFLEADIRARRSPPAGTDPVTIDGVDLTYAIDRGAEAILTIEGDLPSSVRKELLEAWGDSVLTEFLLEDMRQIVQAHLAGRGHVRPAVAAELIQDGARKEILLRFDAGARYRRADSIIVGNTGLDTELIRRRLRTRGLNAADWAHQNELADAVRNLYIERGWLDAEVRASGPLIDGDDARLRIEIDEGRRYRLGSMRVSGNALIGSELLLDALALQPGDDYDRDALAAGGDAVLEVYLQRGHNGTTVRAAADGRAETAVVDIELVVEEAPQQILTELRIDGLQHVRRSVVERAISAELGTPLVRSDLQSARQRLYATGVFERIKLDVVTSGVLSDGRQPVVLQVEVTEAPRLQLRYGVQLFSDQTLEDQRETRPGVAATLSHSGLLGLPADLSATARYRGKDRLIRGVLGFRGLFGAPVRTALIGERSRSEVEGFFTTRSDDTQFTLEQRVNVSTALTVGYSYNVKHTRSTLLGQQLQLEPVTSARLVPTIIYDSRDDRLDPGSGLFHSATLEWAPASLGSELLFRTLHLKQYAFLSLGRLTFASAIRFASGVSLDPTSTRLPRSERFVAGGATSLRGYPDDAVGGSDFFGSFVPGGNAVLVLNQEARFPIWRWIRGVAFVDAGSAFESASDIRLGRLKASTGLGLRLATPYLMLRLDYGLRLGNLSHLPDASRGRFHFGIGHIF